MANAKKNNSKNAKTKQNQGPEAGVIDNIWGVIFVAVGIFLFAAITFDAAGQFGTVLGDFFKGLFGIIGLVLPWYLIGFGLLLFMNKTVHISPVSAIMAFVVLLMLCLLNSGRFIQPDNIYFDFQDFYRSGVTLEGGGLFGMPISMILVKYMGKVGLYTVAIVVIVVLMLLIINTPVSQGIASLKQRRIEKQEERLTLEAEQNKLIAQKEKERAKAEKEKEKQERAAQKAAEKATKQLKLDLESDTSKLDTKLESASEIKVGEFPAFDDKDVELKADEPKEAGFFASLMGGGKSKKKKEEESAIFDLLNDDTIFEKKEPTKPSVDELPPSDPVIKTFGLEEPNSTPPGYGLDGDSDAMVSSYNKSFGLDGNSGITQDSEPDIIDFEPASYVEKDDGQLVIDDYDLGNFGTDTLSSGDFGMEKPKLDETAKTAAAGAAGAAGAVAGTVAGAASQENQPKLSKKEAEALNLKDEDFNKVKKKARYKKPPIDLLDKPVHKGQGNVSAELKMKAATLEETLKSFNVDAKVIQVTQGPAVTRYEIQPAVGVKVNSIVRLSDDIALNLRAKSIRMEAPIPGKAAVGIEVENEKVNTVNLREIIDSQEFKQAKSKISFAVGRDITGKSIVGDLKGMPHLLIAGSTGSGKSVCINSIITSILYKADPDEVKLVLIDPKVVELGNYNGIPHLLVPVVTDPSKAAATLNWAVSEMTKRYKAFADAKVRDLSGYNEFVKSDGRPDEAMPQVVIIIDELADLMMAAPSQVEESICRLAQMARAAGMHLIVATQRPSVDIITGVIKANIPSRIAFAVSSQFDSRTILDMAGAEKLVGKGDMLFNPLGMGKPVRVQGTFVSDKEVQRVIEFVKGQTEEVEYSEDVIDTIEKGNITLGKDDDTDELLPDAIECVVKSGTASVSMLQRRFRIGYNRGARIMDMMEERGIVGPQDGSRPRQVLMSEEELEALKNEGDE